MGSFNFYINVDQCLNMSNFDMFFYKLQSEQKFHLSNVQFFDDAGENSLQAAFYGIRSYMDKMPFLIQDYRLIFGMREELLKNPTWKDTILYRLLKIYYGLMDASIFIKSKDAADKNVSVIMLYDTDFTFDAVSLGRNKYDLAKDLERLMDYLGIEWKNGVTNQEIRKGFETFLESKDREFCRDEITRRFARSYIQWLDYLMPPDDEADVLGMEQYDDAEELLTEELELQDGLVSRRKNGPNAHSTLYTLITFASECVGHYCVFQKEINKNTLDQNLLALLSIVDYITSDLKSEKEDGRLRTNETLKEQSRRNWERANNDTGIQQRYGTMIARYKARLQTAQADMQKRVTDFTRGVPAPNFTAPEKLSGTQGLKPQDEDAYRGEFEAILNQFIKNSVNRKTAESSWRSAYKGLKEKLDRMEEELKLYARDLSAKYKRQLEERKTKNIHREDKTVYSQDDIEEKIEAKELRRTELLEKLKKPQMNPSLTFQDQLNLEHTLEQCNLEVSFFVKCHKMIRLLNFFLLILISGGIFCLHYILMQGYLFSDLEKLSAFLMYVGAVFVLSLLAWNAPYYYFKKKIMRAMDELKKQMEVFIRGYFDKADNFREYINTINELDAVTAYIDRLKEIRETSAANSREYLWHKVQIQEHLRKSGYFENLMYSLDLSQSSEERDESVRLDVRKDVIHNRLYWPQGKQEGEHV